ncbi:MAG TPA: tetratricopeptide repeat protein [Gammaproteobacteria bacterium]|nr:tetratricopeptide repeat protein [Gammaproteobacteria bacterium]
MNMQRQTIRFALFALILSGSAFATESKDSIVRETSADSAFKGALYQIWSHLRALSPKSSIEEAGRSKIVVTAGIRGAETTDTALKPYWKDDRSNDQQYQQQLASYDTARQLIDKGDMKGAAASLEKFIEQHPGSELAPNAVFAEAMALAGMGDKEASIKQFNRFIKENPKHPLRADAETAIKELGGSAQ